MKEAPISIENELGLHMRAAGKFARLAGRFRSRVTLVHNGAVVDGKSIVGLLTLAAAKGVTLVLRTEGDDEAEAFAALQELVSGKFGEEA